MKNKSKKDYNTNDKTYYFLIEGLAPPNIAIVKNNVIQMFGRPYKGIAAYRREGNVAIGPICNTPFLPELLQEYGGIL